MMDQLLLQALQGTVSPLQVDKQLTGHGTQLHRIAHHSFVHFRMSRSALCRGQAVGHAAPVSVTEAVAMINSLIAQPGGLNAGILEALHAACEELVAAHGPQAVAQGSTADADAMAAGGSSQQHPFGVPAVQHSQQVPHQHTSGDNKGRLGHSPGSKQTAVLVGSPNRPTKEQPPAPFSTPHSQMKQVTTLVDSTEQQVKKQGTQVKRPEGASDVQQQHTPQVHKQPLLAELPALVGSPNRPTKQQPSAPFSTPRSQMKQVTTLVDSIELQAQKQGTQVKRQEDATDVQQQHTAPVHDQPLSPVLVGSPNRPTKQQPPAPFSTPRSQMKQVSRLVDGAEQQAKKQRTEVKQQDGAGNV